MSNKLITLISFLVLSQNISAAEYFVRPAGGTLSQCDGLTNTDYNASITNKACAVKHIFELLNPETNAVNISGGDIVTIMNNADGSQSEYELGRHDTYTDGDCNSSWNYTCTMPPIPSGTATAPTIIRGETWNSSCTTPPQLWGSGRAMTLFSIKNGSHIQLSCMELTDHSSCIGASGYPDASLKCDRSAPYDKDFADVGIKIEVANNLTFNDLTISGLDRGLLAGGMTDVSFNRVNLYANFGAGWDGDIGDNSSNTGNIFFNDSAITFSGCGLIYNPGQADHNTPHACAKQDLGGYGDGIGTAATAGNWVFDNATIMYNNSDGIDLLYHSLGGKVTVRNSRIEGNGGNQLKISGNSEIVNNIIISNCGWNSRQDPSLGANGETCRALGTPLLLNWVGSNDTVTVLNNTVVSEGDCLLQTGSRLGAAASTQTLNVVNNMFYGVTDYLQNYENTCMYYAEPGFVFPNKQIHNNIVHKTKTHDDPCVKFQTSPLPAGSSAGDCSTTSTSFYNDTDYTVSTNPKFISLNLGIRNTAYDLQTLHLESNKVYPKDATSPLVNAGYLGTVGGVAIPDKDYFGMPRGTQPDIGAVELTSINADKPERPVIDNVSDVAE